MRRSFASIVNKMPTLYTSIGSPPGRTVMMLQGLLDLKLEIKPLEPVAREQDTPEFTKMATLYTEEKSPPGRAARMVAGILNLNLKVVEVNPVIREQDTPEFTKKNPMRTVPIFEDEEGFCLADSHAIMIHFMEKYAKPEFQYLYPKDINKRSTINSRLYFDCGILFPRLRNVMAPAIVGKLTEISKTNKWQFNDAYRTLEYYLSETKYVADNEMTIADISICSTVSAMDGLYGIDDSKKISSDKKLVKNDVRKGFLSKILQRRQRVFRKWNQKLNRKQQS